MIEPAAERPPYRSAAVAFAVVLAGYLYTLAPTVTFWDAGELIASSKILGIPHPPGTPLFVLMAHVWALLFPVGEFAWRTNLMSAAFSAAGAGFWFLSSHEVIDRAARDLSDAARRWVSRGGAAAAALISGFGFTQWQNSNETEVYSFATLTIAATVWLALRWRAHRGTPRAGQMLLLAVYLGGLSIGSHLLALLVGPGLVLFLAAELRRHPAAEAAQRREEWGQFAVVAGVWALLIGTGLGNTALITLGLVSFGTAAALAIRGGSGRFALLAAVIAAIGVTSYLFLFIRAGQAPMINEADPSTWDALLAVIRREQYPLRTPLDNPTQLHGPENAGRSLTIIGLQLLNYLQYFDWQWAKSLSARVGSSAVSVPLHTLVTLAVVSLGTRGLFWHRRADRSSWWLFLGVFLVTGLGLVAYMNFRPGFSVGHDLFPDPGDHEVRERDYFFVVSFIVWGVWTGIGLAELAGRFVHRKRAALGAGVLALAVVPFLLNFSAASRRHGADTTLAADFAYNLLNSVPPNGILFTYGDNDTFPLWWAQEVQGIRPDVTVVCLALAETQWYMQQLRDNPSRPFDPALAPAIWRALAAARPEWPAHTMTDAEIESAQPQRLPSAVRLRYGPHEVTLPAGTALYGKDFVSIRILQQNFGRRPVAWSITAAGSFYGLDDRVVQEGLAIRVLETPPDSTDDRYDFHRVMGVPLDRTMTDSLLFGAYQYGRLLELGPDRLESTALSMSATLGVPFTQMAIAAEERGDNEAAVRYYTAAVALSTNPTIRGALAEARARLTSK
ncbi:MAG: DUF2723 domain-containing protein [Gemmatimonadota bacterium]